MVVAVAVAWPRPAEIAPETPAVPVEGGDKTVDERWGGHHHHNRHHGNYNGGYGGFSGYGNFGGYNTYGGDYLGWREGQKTPERAAAAAAVPSVPAPASDKVNFQ